MPALFLRREEGHQLVGSASARNAVTLPTTLTSPKLSNSFCFTLCYFSYHTLLAEFSPLPVPYIARGPRPRRVL
jgi:hypothetical protein